MIAASQALPIAREPGPGQVLGRYELLYPIAAGGMAMVWAARLSGTRGFQKIVAVKTMLPKLSEDDQFEQMFLDEASLASQIRHPHVVEILDLGEQDGVLFLAMEWIEGVPLNQLMKAAKPKGGIPLPIAARIVSQACSGLHAAHELRDVKGQLVGLVHRDISPQNLLVTYDGVVKVVDFGVAKATAIGGGATNAGQLKGKVSYMAPEQVRGESIDRRVDVFAMGIVLYALTTGKHPFRRESEASTMYNIASDAAVVPPHRVNPDYPKELEAVVLKALAKKPSERYANANELLKALDQALPAAERAQSDEDVGAFVTSVLGDRRERDRTLLQEALERSSKTSLSALRIQEPLTHSQTSAVSGISASIVQPASTTLTSIEQIDLAYRKRRTWQLWLGAAVLFALGAGAAFAFGIARAPQDPVTTTLRAAEARPATAATPAAPTRETVAAPQVDLNTLPVEAPTPSALPPGTTSAVAPVWTRPNIAVPKPAAATSAAPKPAEKAPAPTKPAWKHDPGF